MMARSPKSASPEKNRGTDQDGIARLRNSAPTTKSYWSRPDAFAPRGRCRRRFTNAPTRSPRRAPKERMAEAANATAGGPKDHDEDGVRRWNGRDRRSPRIDPARVPPTRPRHVLPSPKIRCPSERLRPRSIGGPPPKTTAIGFAMNAGRKNHRAWGIASRATGAAEGEIRGYRYCHGGIRPSSGFYLCSEVRFRRARILSWGLRSSARAARCAPQDLAGPAGGTRAACGRPPVWISPRGRGPRNPRGVRSGRPPVHNARSTGTRSHRSDVPADHSRPASRSPRFYLCLEVSRRSEEHTSELQSP